MLYIIDVSSKRLKGMISPENAYVKANKHIGKTSSVSPTPFESLFHLANDRIGGAM